MEHVGKRLSCAEANQMDIVDYLSTIGIEPANIKGEDFWYISPFRDERTASFKVDRRLNRWYDHGEGQGGKLVDFGVAYHRCSVGELLRRLGGSEPLPVPQKKAANLAGDEGNRILILGVKPLSSPALIRYGESRLITPVILQKYCSEVSYNNGGKSYYAIGFKNELGGFELRSKYFKGSSSPKAITHIKTGENKLAVFEGFFNFLSFQQLHKNEEVQPSDFLILNSLSFFEKARPLMESYPHAELYLDNNKAGQDFTTRACSLSKVYEDKSGLYGDHEDLNDFLVQQAPETVIQQRPGRRLRL